MSDMTERAQAIVIAERFLDEPYADPDSDQCVLARQFNRSQEEIERLRNDTVPGMAARFAAIEAERDRLRSALTALYGVAEDMHSRLSNMTSIHETERYYGPVVAAAQLLESINGGADTREDSVRQARDTPCDATPSSPAMPCRHPRATDRGDYATCAICGALVADVRAHRNAFFADEP